MKKHPQVLVYNPQRSGFAFLLIIGREPNYEGELERVAGSYDFDQAPRCTFWNRTYGLLAHGGGSATTSQLKSTCRSKKASPIAYADSLPICLPNVTANKGEARSRLASSEINNHVAGIFSYPIVERVSLVLLAILTKSQMGSRSVPAVFDASTRAIEATCASRQIPFAHIPFPSCNCSIRDLLAALAPENLEILRKIYREFTQGRDC